MIMYTIVKIIFVIPHAARIPNVTILPKIPSINTVKMISNIVFSSLSDDRYRLPR